MAMVAAQNNSLLPFLQFPKTTATKSFVKRKLTIKIGPKGVRFEPEKESSEYGAHVLMHDEFTRETSLKEHKKLNMNRKVKLPVQGHSRKRRADMVLDAQKEKRQRMDGGIRGQRRGILKKLRKPKTEGGIRQWCGGILKELMTHKYGSPINKPMDCGSRISCEALASRADSKCGLCGHLTCQCTLQNSKGQAPSNGCTPFVDVQLSPKKALRAAMLKSRFADTISRAQKTLLHQGDKADPVKSRLQKVRLEKQQHEEKARIEAKIIATDAALRRRAEADLKIQREREREAARIALQQMEKTVEIDDNLKYFKELEMLSQSPTLDYPFVGPEVVMHFAEGGRVGNTLERFGLYIKEDFAEGDDEEMNLYRDREEGEILSE